MAEYGAPDTSNPSRKTGKILCIASGKGGVGKTLTSVGIAHCIARATSSKVLLIDADPSGRTAEFLTEPGAVSKYGWVEFINGVPTPAGRRDVLLEECLTKSSLEDNLYIIKSTSAEALVYGGSDFSDYASERILLFKSFIDDFPDYAFAVIDLPATITSDHVAYSTIFRTVLVSSFSLPEINAVKRYKDAVEKWCRKHGLRNMIEGVIANKVVSGEEAERIGKMIGLPLIGAIPYSRKVEEASERKLPVTAYAPEDKASIAICEIARKLSGLEAYSYTVRGERGRESSSKFLIPLPAPRKIFGLLKFWKKGK